MASIAVDEFSKGVDVRRPAGSSGGDTLRLCRNAYVTTGKTIRKRPGLVAVATLEAGTKGLRAHGGKLQTFYDSGAVITHANTLFNANRVKNPTGDSDVVRLWYCDSFAGSLYAAVEYANGSVWHHYLEDVGAWQPTTVYALGAFARPTSANGFNYEATTGGTSAGSEPTWPTTVGGTVVDGTVTWTCRSTYVADANCPHGRGVTKAATKIWSTKQESPFDTVRFCAAADPRDWTTASDAGSLPVATSQENAQDCYALGQFQKQLVAYFQDSAQLWDVDPDPANNAIAQRLFGSGTRYPMSVASFADDNFFLADAGVRSITISSQTANLQDSDVGSPVDALIPSTIGANTPRAIYVAPFGQFWLILGTRVWVYSFSRMSKLAAWSEYNMPFAIDDIAILDNVVYIRNGDNVYRFSDTAYKDGVVSIPVEIHMPFLDMKSPGIGKQFFGMDVIGIGTAVIEIMVDPYNTDRRTPAVIAQNDTRGGTLVPMEVLAQSVAPVIKNSADGPFELAGLQFYFEKLGFAI